MQNKYYSDALQRRFAIAINIDPDIGRGFEELPKKGDYPNQPVVTMRSSSWRGAVP